MILNQELNENSNTLIYESYINDRIKSETFNSEFIIIRFYKYFIAAFLSIPIIFGLLHYIKYNEINIFFITLSIYIIIVWIYYWNAESIIKKNPRNFNVVRLINITLEMSSASIVFLNMHRVFGAAVILSGPLILLYLVIIIVTGFRYSLKLSLFAGFLAAFQHLLLYFYIIGEVPLWLYESIIDFRFSGIFQKTLYLLLSGVVSSLLGLYSKSLISKITLESLENIKLRKLFGQYVSEEIRDLILDDNIDRDGDEINGIILFLLWYK